MNHRGLLAAAALSACFGCSERKETLHVYSWSDYFDPEMVEAFEAEYGCLVEFTTFDSNESMYAKLKSGADGYDVIVPSSYLIPTLVNEGILAKMDHSKLPNVLGNFEQSLSNQVLDASFEYSVPYACTYTGLMYDKYKVGEVRSWAALGDKAYHRRVSLLDDVRELVGIGLVMNGHSLNSTNEVEIAEAVKWVVGVRGNVRKFDAESYKNEVANGSIWIGHGYSSDAAQVIIGDGRSDIGFALPDEGFTVAWDEFVVMKGAANKDLAFRFIDFFNREDVAYRNMLYICSLVPVKGAIARMPEEYRTFLLPKNIEKGELLRGLTDERALEAYNRAFDEIKAKEMSRCQ